AVPRDAARASCSVDWPGAFVLGAATTALLLGLVWGGRDHPWGSPHVVAALCAGAVLLAAFGLVERRARETLLPFALLRTRTVGVGIATLALGGTALIGTMAFVPLFAQGVLGVSATSSGAVVVPFLLSASRFWPRRSSSSPVSTRPRRRGSSRCWPSAQGSGSGSRCPCSCSPSRTRCPPRTSAPRRRSRTSRGRSAARSESLRRPRR